MYLQNAKDHCSIQLIFLYDSGLTKKRLYKIQYVYTVGYNLVGVQGLLLCSLFCMIYIHEQMYVKQLPCLIVMVGKSIILATKFVIFFWE